MKRWLVVSLVALIGLGLGAAGAQAKDQYVLRLGIEHGPDHPYTQAMKRFSTLIGQKTGGSVEIKLYPGHSWDRAPK